MLRIDGRLAEQLRPLEIEINYIKHAEGSVLIHSGDTKVICTASVEDKVPPFMRGEGKGWITAEYSMLPRATQVRNQRESAKGKLSGRTMEIQRLIGRACRSVVDLKKLGERTIWIDCDVVQADGGTRTAAISGAFVAMFYALVYLLDKKALNELPITDLLAATSVGLVDNVALLDLNYHEDALAKVDMNVVMTGAGRYVEIQGTGEEYSYSRDELDQLLELANVGIQQINEAQIKALGAHRALIQTQQAIGQAKDTAYV